MKHLITLFIIFTLTGCAHTAWAPPSILYSDSNSIGVEYSSGSGGLLDINRTEEAMKMVSDHCNGKYKITNRVAGARTTIGAQCE